MIEIAKAIAGAIAGTTVAFLLDWWLYREKEEKQNDGAIPEGRLGG